VYQASTERLYPTGSTQAKQKLKSQKIKQQTNSDEWSSGPQKRLDHRSDHRRQLSSSPYFDAFFAAVVLLNAIYIGIEALRREPEFRSFLDLPSFASGDCFCLCL